MALYEYKGVDASGKNVKGVIEADSSKTARTKLKKSGIMITSVNERDAKNKSNDAMSISFLSGINVADKAMMTRQFASLMKANIPVVDSLNAVIDQCENPKLKLVMSDIKQKVNEGTSVAKAMAAHTDVFDNLYINMVESGEASGTLPMVLMKLADFQESQVRLKQKVMSAMTYPLLMLVAGTGLLVLIFTVAIPKITKVFETMKKQLPIQTRILIWISNALIEYWWAVLLVSGLTFFIFKKWKATPAGQVKWDNFKLTAPLFGKIFRMIAITRFAGTLSTLLSSGVPIVAAMNIVKNVVMNKVIEAAIESAKENIKEGQTIAEPLKKSGQFPPMVIHMISIGEKTGELPTMLNNLGKTYEEQVDSKIQSMTSILEPLMMIGMGVTVAVIVVSIYVPIIEMNNISK